MTKENLTAKEINDLLIQYEADRRKLSFQLKQIDDAIARLQQELGIEPKAPKAPQQGIAPEPVKRPRGRPPKPIKIESVKPAKKAPLSLDELCTLLLKILDSEQRVLASGDFIQKFNSYMPNASLSFIEIAPNITVALYNLSKDGRLIVLPASVGQVYALPKWIDKSSGRLQEKYAKK